MAQRLVDNAPATAGREIDRTKKLGIEIVTIVDPEYPDSLRSAPLPPPVIYVLGQLTSGPAVAIVGSRRPDHYGREAAHFFGHHLAQRGVTVVSGFARGVDEAAHRGALNCPNGRTLAVLGCGIDVPYPSHREELVAAVRDRGAMVSEFPLGTQPLARNFPVRNRIIAALGQSTVVIQATPRSGSLITARYAMEMGRDVFALPGRIFDDTALGPNALLRDGAGIALHPDDLLRDLPGASSTSSEEVLPPLAGTAMGVWKAIPRGDVIATDRLAERVDLRIDRLLGLLLELELGGWVHRHPGSTYSRHTR